MHVRDLLRSRIFHAAACKANILRQDYLLVCFNTLASYPVCLSSVRGMWPFHDICVSATDEDAYVTFLFV